MGREVLSFRDFPLRHYVPYDKPEFVGAIERCSEGSALRLPLEGQRSLQTSLFQIPLPRRGQGDLQ